MRCALICAPEHDIRINARKQLKELGLDAILEFADGDTAVQAASVNDLEIAIMDVTVRKKNRCNAAYAVSRISKCPVILLAVYYDQEVVKVAKRIGAASVLLKPFRGEDLKFSIEMACAHAEEVEILRENATDIDEISTTKKLLKKAEALLGQSEGLNSYEAFRLIRKTALANRISMRNIAEAIILKEDLYRTTRPNH